MYESARRARFAMFLTAHRFAMKWAKGDVARMHKLRRDCYRMEYSGPAPRLCAVDSPNGRKRYDTESDRSWFSRKGVDRGVRVHVATRQHEDCWHDYYCVDLRSLRESGLTISDFMDSRSFGERYYSGPGRPFSYTYSPRRRGNFMVLESWGGLDI